MAYKRNKPEEAKRPCRRTAKWSKYNQPIRPLTLAARPRNDISTPREYLANPLVDIRRQPCCI